MILFYRPELDNPPMDSNSTLGFSFIEKDKTENIVLEPGANQDFPEEVWEKIKNYKVVRNLLAYGALRIISETDHEVLVAESQVDSTVERSLEHVSIADAMTMIESSMEPTQLEGWLARESRIKLRNAINKRLKAIEDGNA